MVPFCGFDLYVRMCNLADVSTPVNGVELASRDKVLEAEPCRNDVQPIDSHVEGSYELHFRDTNCPSSTSMPEAVQAPKRAGRASRNSSGSLKRPRLAQLEDNMISAVLDEVKDISDNIGTYPSTKCNSLGNDVLLFMQTLFSYSLICIAK